MTTKTVQASNTTIPIWLSLTLSLGLVACHDHDHDHEADEATHLQRLVEEACHHLENGPSQSVTAAAEGQVELPDITHEHTRIDLTLVAWADDMGGLVSFSAGDDDDYHFFLDRVVPMLVFDADGDEVLPQEAPHDAPNCALVGVHRVYPLLVGTYTLQFGPTSEASLSLVFEAFGEVHHHHDH